MLPLTRSRNRARFFGIPFSPSQLFSSGEQGAWYDPSDLSTMFNDAAGTQPITSFTTNQPVGLLLDKSKGAVGTNGAARYNLLTRTEEFENAAWAKSNVTVPITNVLAPNNTLTADFVLPTTANAEHYLDVAAGATIPATSGTFYKLAVSAKAGGYNWLRIAFNSSIMPASNRAAWFDLQNGVLGTVQAGVTATITAQPNGFWLCTIERAATTTAIPSQFGFFQVTTADNFAAAFAGDGTSGIYLWGADLRLTADAAKTPTYQPITSSWAATIPGNHATASGSARPVLSKRYNLLTRTEEFNDAVWSKTGLNAFGSGSVANTNATTDPIGGNTADFIQENTANTQHYVNTAFGTPAISTGVLYTQVFYAKPAGRNIVYVQNGAAGTGYGGAFITLSGAGSVSNYFNGLASGVSVRSVGTGWYEIVMQFTAANTNGSCIFAMSNALGTQTYTGDGTSGIYIWGADLRRTIDANAFQPAYQRVVTATDYDGDGFLPYLEYSGAQAMATGSIDFTAGDKMSVWAGVTKLSDAAVGFLVGHQTWPVTGGFGLYAPSYISAPGAKYYLGLQGTSLGQVEYATYAAPITNVLSNALDIGGAAISDEIKTRINGVSVVASASSGSAGTGNFPNTPLTIGAYNAVGNFFTGRQYSLIVRGAQSSAAQISATESWINQRTGAY